MAEVTEIERLREEVAYWRRDNAARLFFASCRHKSAVAAGDAQEALLIRVNDICPLLCSLKAADAGEWHTNCEACGKPLRNGQQVHNFEDAGAIHVDCDNPDAAQPDEHSHPYDDGFTPDQMTEMVSQARAIFEAEDVADG